MPQFVVENVKRLLTGIDNAKVAVFGLTYKGDVRYWESPAVDIYTLLQDENLDVWLMIHMLN